MGEARPPSTRSISADFSSGETRAEASTASNLGKRSSTSAHQGVELREHRRRLAGLFRRVQQALGVDVGDVLDAHLGLHLGRGAGIVRR